MASLPAGTDERGRTWSETISEGSTLSGVEQVADLSDTSGSSTDYNGPATAHGVTGESAAVETPISQTVEDEVASQYSEVTATSQDRVVPQIGIYWQGTLYAL